MKTYTAHTPAAQGYHSKDPLDPAWRPEPRPTPPPPGPRRPADHQPPPAPRLIQPPPPDYRMPDERPYRRDVPVHAAPPEHTPSPSPQPGEPDGGVSVEARWWADLRQQIVYRAKRLNTGHMIEADQRYRQRDALGPHGVMLFFVSDAPAQPHGYQLHTAYRLWLASPESQHLPRLLADLTDVVTDSITRAGAAGRRWHPLGPHGSMVNGGDMTLPAGAVYVGAGVTTLDSDQGRWQQLARTLRSSGDDRRRSVFDLKGQCFVLLTDGTALHVDRDPHAPIGADGVRCTKPLDPDRVIHYNPHEHLTEQGDTVTRNTWTQLTRLHRTLAGHLLAGRPA
ncbi:hypothetical protein ACFUYE_03870 [Micromonospora humida]|uniref:hypothetical protein n=1 Tax=Micromonospora humida TaxID=2809018 RepID=UPI00366ACFC7